jgi:hypothetical protein
MSTPKSNVCWYWCFEDKSNPSEPWCRRHNCAMISSLILAIILGLIALFTVIYGVMTIMGFMTDAILDKSVCHAKDGVFPFVTCFNFGGMAFMWYALNLFFSVFEVGPLMFLCYVGVLNIEFDLTRIILIVCLSIVSFGISIFFNPLLGWLWYSINPGWVAKCSVNQLRDLFDFGCTVNGMVPLGLSLFGLNLVVIAVIYTCVSCITCCRKARQRQEGERQRLILA